MKNNRRKRRRKWPWIVLILVVIGAVAAVLLLSGDKPVNVQIDKVTKGHLEQIVSASGTVEPAVMVEISATISGEIQNLRVREGDRVEKGQVLLTLDSQRYEATNAQSGAALAAARAQARLAAARLDLAEKTYKRQQDLFAKSLTTKEALDAAETEWQVAQATLKAAEDSINQAQAGLRLTSDELAKTTIRAPMDGVVTRLLKDEGEVAIGSTFTRDVIMEISDPTRIIAKVAVDEADIVEVKLGQAATVEIDALPDVKFAGEVIEIAGSATLNQLGTQEQTVSFEVQVLLAGDTSAIRPGLSATADIVTQTKDDVFQVPIQCVTMRDPEVLEKIAAAESDSERETLASGSGDMTKMKEMLFAVKDGKAEPVWVTSGISSDKNIEVAGDGLAEGLEVVCGNFKTLNRELKPGDQVTAAAPGGEEKKD